MHYLEDTTDEVAEKSDSERVRRIHQRVCKVKANEEIGVKYMQAWEERYYDKQEAREEGLAEGRAEGRAEGQRLILKEQISKKLAKGKAVEQIADELEQEIDLIKGLMEEMEK